MPELQPREQDPSTYVDLHAHTVHSRFNEGVAYSPEQLLRTAKERRLGGIALTGHDTFEGLEGAIEHAEKLGIILVPGVEITSFLPHRRGFHLPHMVALLPTTEALRLTQSNTKPPTLRKPEYVADWVHDHGGVVIAPHVKPKGGITSLSYDQVEKLAHKLDGIETHTTHGVNPDVQELAQRSSLASIGSSDIHRLEEVALVKTAVFGKCETAEDVIDAIRDNRVEGFIETDIPPELVGERDFKSLIEGYRSQRNK